MTEAKVNAMQIEKYQKVINWWNSLLANAFPPPQTLSKDVQVPEFVKEAKRLLSNV